jgi:hypothetical protein
VFITAILGCHFSTKRDDHVTKRDSLFDFRVFIRVSKPDFPRIFLFEFQVVRISNPSNFGCPLYIKL